jgi:hypothetical protein
MNSLDSRAILYGDSFVQVFSQPGRYRYGFSLPALSRLNPLADCPFTIDVKESRERERKEGKQHTILVRFERGQLMVDRSELEIEAGDAALWSISDPATPGLSISGYSETHSFNSAAINSEAVYAHPFGTAGIFKWRDANGNGPSGTVEVTMPQIKTPREIAAYQERLNTEATVVVINGTNVERADVKIYVGQAVFFIVEKANGITITDERLIFEAPVP